MDYKIAIAEQIAKTTGLDCAEIESYIETPPLKEMGDFAFPCFKLAKTMRQAPPAIAVRLSGELTLPACFDKCECAGGYLNFFVNPAKRAENLLKQIDSLGECYGSTQKGNGKTVCIDYSSINIAKRCHIGHLTTTVLGNSLAKIHRFNGYNVVSINHLGDWGTQFGKLICAYKTWGSRENIVQKGIDALVELYVRFEREADEQMQTDARQWFKRIEDKDPEALEIFSWFKEITLNDVAKIYELLDIHFDSYAGESFYMDKWGAVIDELNDKKMLVKSEGAYVVPLDEFDMPPCILLKSDGTSIYATRDLAAAMYRKKTYNFDKCLYVVAYQQNLHFKQVFKVIELMGYDWAKDLIHVPFGMVSFEGETLSTRKGRVIYLDELLKRACAKALDIINQKNPELENKEEISKQIGIGSVIFYDLFNSRIKDVDFWWERALNFDGETAPYVQYTHTRCCSLIAKAPELNAENADFSALSDDASQELVAMLEAFPDAVADALEKYEPSVITRYSAALAQSFNKFYFENRIIGEPEPVLQARLLLVKCTKTTIKTALGLLGIAAPEKM